MPISKPALQEYLESEFQGAFYVRSKTVAVAATPTIAVPNDFERLGLVIINLSASDLYLAPDPEVSTTSGILLTGSGSSLSLVAHDDLVLVGYGWYALATAAPQSIYTLEVLRYRGVESR